MFATAVDTIQASPILTVATGVVLGGLVLAVLYGILIIVLTIATADH